MAYTSPLPTPRPHLGHAIASEWTKMASVRSTVLTLGSLVLLVVGIGLAAVSQTSGENFRGTPYTAPALFGLLVGQLAVMVLGVLTMTSEHGTGLIRTTFTAAPDRHRVLTAKYLVVAGVSFVAIAASVTFVALAGAIVHHRPDAGPHDIPRELLGGLAGSFYVTLLGVLALAVGALVRHSAGGIAVMIGVVTVPPFTGGMLSMWEATQPVGSALIRYNSPVALMQLFGLPDADTGSIPPAWVHFALLFLVTGAAVAGSYLAVGRRDV
ncbi:ABC transporter permease [Streptomyces sp. WAC06614]|nr:ABC transporter permease [Streptomyces sp. WAC06614]